jgi:hypothetical protein
VLPGILQNHLTRRANQRHDAIVAARLIVPAKFIPQEAFIAAPEGG